MSTEKNIHKAFAHYLKEKYPNVVFTSESSGVRVTMGQAVALKEVRSAHTHPDVFISEPKGSYHGLYIELKKESPLKKDGTLKMQTEVKRRGPLIIKVNHLEEQFKTIELLRSKGYCAFFSSSLDNAMEITDRYMELKCEETLKGKYLLDIT